MGVVAIDKRAALALGRKALLISKGRPQKQSAIYIADNHRYHIDDRGNHAVKPILMQPDIVIRNRGVLILGKDHVVIKTSILKNL